MKEEKRTIMITWVFILVVCFMSGYFYIAPYTTILGIRTATETNDYLYLRENIDFPAIKESIRDQLSTLLITGMKEDPELKDNPFNGLFTLFTGAYINKAVDTFVNPVSVSKMFSDNIDKKVNIFKLSARPEFGFKDLSTFIINTIDYENNKPVTLIMKRKGLYTWILKDIIM